MHAIRRTCWLLGCELDLSKNLRRDDPASRCRLPPWLAGSMMKRMSFSETIFLFVLALVIFGPKKLPEIARQIGKALNEFRRASNEFKSQIEQEISNLDLEQERQ